MKLSHLLLCALSPLLFPFAASAAAPVRPNVLFFFCDDQRADTLAALGNTHIKTPNLDRLVQRGVSFRRAYMMGGMHGATCVPSRAMLLSGQSLFHIDEKLLRDETWPAAFGRAGYTTFMSGKWHNTPPSIAKSFQRARSVFVGGMTDPMKAQLVHLENERITPPHARSDERGHVLTIDKRRCVEARSDGSATVFGASKFGFFRSDRSEGRVNSQYVTPSRCLLAKILAGRGVGSGDLLTCSAPFSRGKRLPKIRRKDGTECEERGTHRDLRFPRSVRTPF